MLFKVLQTLLIHLIVFTFAFEDIFVNGENTQEMIDQGRTQYQLLREKSNLPRYGSCWKSALEHVDEGCKNLSEDTQSDIALHLTNCFLAMSGHETYKCELDKKPNLRGICINSMTDRAFNVYTKFFTHTQNICWFLRGQIWQETITDNAFKVGKQLEVSAQHQEELLSAQRESLQAQEKILHHGKLLEEVLEDLYVSTKAHQEILRILTKSFSSFQVWAIGEMSWFDSMIFYSLSGVFMFIFTTVKRTVNARLPLLLFLFTNLVIERVLCYLFISDDEEARVVYADLYALIWYCRNCFILIEFAYLVYYAYNYRDLTVENNKFLMRINEQNARILEVVETVRNSLRITSPVSSEINLINESYFTRRKQRDEECNESTSSGFSELKENHFKTRRNHYNLRSKQNTPDIHC